MTEGKGKKRLRLLAFIVLFIFAFAEIIPAFATLDVYAEGEETGSASSEEGLKAVSSGETSATAYSWTDSSGNTLTSGISTTTTTYYGVNNTGSAAYYRNGSYQDGASNVSYTIVNETHSDKTTYVLSSSGTFKLTENLQADIIVGPGTSDSTLDVTIDLNGYTLTGTGYSSVIIALAYTNVTICDSSEDGTGVITGGVGTYLDQTGVTCVSSDYGASTAYHIYSESIVGRAGGGVFVDVRATVTMTGGTIKGNTAKGLNGEDLTSGTYQYTNGMGMGGGVYVNAKDSQSTTTADASESAGDGEGHFYMTGGTITENTATGKGGGIYGSSDGQYDHYGYTHYNPEIYISGNSTVISNNTAKTGGGIYCSTGGSVSIYDGARISGNTASSGSGGGIYVTGAGLGINTGSADYAAVTISGNTSGSLGGGIYASGTYSSLTISNAGANVTDNTADSSGGGIAATCWYVNISGTTIVSGNTSASKGGGIYLYPSQGSTYNLFGSLKVTNNTSASDGGGIYASSSNLNQLNIYENVEISGNSTTLSSDYWGGGIYADRPTSIYGNVVIKDNSAGQGGGLYLYTTSSKTAAYSITGNVQITGNIAVENGGGIYLRGRSSSYYASLTVNSDTAVLANNAAGTAGSDLFTHGTAETLALTAANGTSTDTTDDDVTFSDGTTITGWYDDSASARWASQTTSGDALTSFSSGTSYALIAAYAKTSENNHTYGDPTWSWTETNGVWTAASVTISCTSCTGDSAHSYTASLTPTSRYTDATCEAAGYWTYTATTVYNGTVYTSTKTVDNSANDPAKGHSYYVYSTSWASSGEYTTSNVSAYIKCSNESTGWTVYASSITSDQTVDGLTFTATFVKGNSTFTATRTVVAAVYSSSGSVSKYYTSIDTLFGTASNMTNGYTTKLLANCTMTSAAGAQTTTKHTIDLNGFTLTYTGTDTAFTVSSSSSTSARTLTMTDSSEAGTGKIVSTNGASIFEVHYALVINGGTYEVKAADNSETAGVIVNGSGYTKTSYIWFQTESGSYSYTSTSTDYGSTITVTNGIFNSAFYAEDSDSVYTGLPAVAISGGWFVSKVEEDHCAEGYKPYANATGTSDAGTEGMYTVGTFSAVIANSSADDSGNYTYTYNPSGTSVDFTVTFGGAVQDSNTYSVKYAKVIETTDEDGNTTTTTQELEDGALPTDVGTYTAQVVSNDSSAFVGSGDTVSFSIVSAEQTITFSGVTANEDGSLSASVCVDAGSVTYTASSAGSGEVTYSISSEDSGFSIDASTGKVTFTGTGTAVITATAAADSNYNTASASYTLTVKDHTAGKAVIENKIDATCTEDGSYDTVVYCTDCGNKLSRETVTVEATGHSWGNPAWTWTKTDTGYTAEAVFTCKNDKDHTETVTAAVTSETGDGEMIFTAKATGPDGKTYYDTETVELSSVTGNVIVDSAASESAPETAYEVDKKALEKKLLDDTESEAVENGGEATFLLKVTTSEDNTVSDADMALADEEAEANDLTIGQYLDISLHLTVTNIFGETITEEKITDTEGVMYTITITIPEELIKEGRTYYLIHVHEGEPEIIDSEYDEKANTLTFKTDKFSAYAIAYTDAGAGDAAPTGDTNNIALWICIAAIAVIALAAVALRKKIREK